MSKIKRLFFDIETLPCVGFFWGPGHKISIPYDNILHEGSIICICYKWQGGRVQYLTMDSNKCDKKMLQAFIKIANEADELVGHNSDKFDLAWIRTRCLIHEIEMFPTYVTADTLKVSRGKFRFYSNRLDYIAQRLGYGGKHKTGHELWKKVWAGCRVSLGKMVRYCKRDVLILEKIYGRFAPHMMPKVRANEKTDSCPECSSKKLSIKDRRILVSGTVKLVIKCNGCGKHHSRTEKKGDRGR